MVLRESNTGSFLVRGAFFSALFALLMAGFFIQRFPEEASHPLPAVVAVLLIAVPSLLGVARWLGARRAVLLLGSLALFAYAIEYVGVTTGFPYSSFSYGSSLGLLLFGAVPLVLPFAYVPLVLGTVALFWPLRVRAEFFVFAVAVTLTVVDFVLDPGAVVLGHWAFALGGAYYGVPWLNFAGWLLSGSFAAIIALVVLRDEVASPPRSVSMSLALLVAFWTGIALWFSLRAPLVIGITLLVLYGWWFQGFAKLAAPVPHHHTYKQHSK
jgi:putative membrane protein